MKPEQASLPFLLTCVCGHKSNGMRGSQHQVITCPGCGRKLFVLPASPWPASEEELAKLTVVRLAAGAPPSERPALPRPRWLQPLLAGVVTFLLTVMALVVFWSHFVPQRSSDRGAELRQEVAKARAEVERKDLTRARATLDALRTRLEQPPEDILAAEVRGILHFQRQVELATSLLDTSLEELLVEAHQMPAEEWTGRFNQSYRDRGVVFDALVEADLNGGPDYRLDYVLEARGIPGRIALVDFTQARELWRTKERQRWLFGGKLASFRLEADPARPPGQWVVRFRPMSMVLLTDAAVLRALGLPEVPELEPLFLRQRDLISLDYLPRLARVQRPGELAEDVRRQHGLPDRLSRQVLAGRYVEQWVYSRQPSWRLNLDCRPGQPSRVSELGPAAPN